MLSPTASLQEPPYVSEGKGGVLEGYIPDMMKQLGEKMNVQFELQLVKDGHYGSKDEDDGSWDGMIGEVVDGVSIVTMF